jgi:hypothetical protein|tara:strand:+ start:1017 stop:1172 length:156 start_codon:yes stop_codon:yes gene_type:complete
MADRHITQILYRFSDGSIEVENAKVSVIDLNFNWVTSALTKLKNYWKRTDD